VTGIEENLFPSFLSMDSPLEMSEERRLFFVALTRARHFLTLTYATSRFKFGKMVYYQPSRFLDEVGEHNLKAPIHKPQNIVYERQSKASVGGNFNGKRSAIPTSDKFQVNPSPTAAFAAGQEVLHPRFGKGKILRIEGNGDNRIAAIRFTLTGDDERKIMLRFAKMEVLA